MTHAWRCTKSKCVSLREFGASSACFTNSAQVVALGLNDVPSLLRPSCTLCSMLVGQARHGQVLHHTHTHTNKNTKTVLLSVQVKPGMVKSYTLYTHPENSYVVSLCTSLNGQAVVCGHMDGSIYRFTFPQVPYNSQGTRRCDTHALRIEATAFGCRGACSFDCTWRVGWGGRGVRGVISRACMQANLERGSGQPALAHV